MVKKDSGVKLVRVEHHYFKSQPAKRVSLADDLWVVFQHIVENRVEKVITDKNRKKITRWFKKKFKKGRH